MGPDKKDDKITFDGRGPRNLTGPEERNITHVKAIKSLGTQLWTCLILHLSLHENEDFLLNISRLAAHVSAICPHQLAPSILKKKIRNLYPI